MNRRFGTGDLLALMGLTLSMVFTILLLVWYLGREGRQLGIRMPIAEEGKFDLVAASLVLMVLGSLFAIVAEIVSLSDQRWLMVHYCWAGLIVTLQVGHSSALPNVSAFIAPGADFFVLLGAALVAIGAYMAAHDIGVWPQRVVMPPVPDTAAKLEQLKRMCEQGLISQEDFERKRAELISRL